MSFEKWINKTIEKVEEKKVNYYHDYNKQYTTADWIYFTDGTGWIIYTSIRESPSSYWEDEAEMCMRPMSDVCMRCGTIRPVFEEDCPAGKEITGAGTEPHIMGR